MIKMDTVAFERCGLNMMMRNIDIAIIFIIAETLKLP